MSGPDHVPDAHRGRYVPSQRYERVTLAQVAREVGRTRKQTAKLLTRLSFVGTTPEKGSDGIITYPAEAINAVKALLDKPHRDLDHTNDWLSQYMKESQ